MPLLRVTLTDQQYSHIDKLADAAGVEHSEVIRTLVKLDMEDKQPQLNPRVVDLVGQLYALVVTNDKTIVKTAPTVAHVKQNRKGTILTPEQDDAIWKMRSQGHTFKEIEEYFKVGHGTAYRAVARAQKRRHASR